MRAVTTIKETVRNSPIGEPLARCRHYLINSVNEAMRVRPRIPITKSRLDFIRLGTRVGGWLFADGENLYGSTIISCGAGEDISFDLLFAEKYNARVIIVDPTPRAIDHVRQIISTISSQANGKGHSRIEYKGYLINGLKPDQLILLDRALWNSEGNLRLFAPTNPAHVSHSASDYQNQYNKEGEYIEVKSVTLQKLLANFDIKRFPLLKIDIEGAEIEVLQHLSNNDILPDQICLEFDELSNPSKLAADRVRSAHEHLEGLGYTPVYKDYVGINFLYVKNNLL